MFSIPNFLRIVIINIQVNTFNFSPVTLNSERLKPALHTRFARSVVRNTPTYGNHGSCRNPVTDNWDRGNRPGDRICLIREFAERIKKAGNRWGKRIDHKDHRT